MEPYPSKIMTASNLVTQISLRAILSVPVAAVALLQVGPEYPLEHEQIALELRGAHVPCPEQVTVLAPHGSTTVMLG